MPPEVENPGAGGSGARVDIAADGIPEHTKHAPHAQQPADPALIRIIARLVRIAALRATHREETAAEGAGVPGVPAKSQAAPLAIPSGRRGGAEGRR
jgi:hypothetical protein